MGQPVSNVIDFNAHRQVRQRRNAIPSQSEIVATFLAPTFILAPMMVPLVWTGGWVFASPLVSALPDEADR